MIATAFLNDSTSCIARTCGIDDPNKPIFYLYNKDGKMVANNVTLPAKHAQISESTYDQTPLFKHSKGELFMKPKFSNKTYKIMPTSMPCVGDIHLEGRMQLEHALYYNVKEMSDFDDGGLDYINNNLNTILTLGTGYIENDIFILSLVEYKTDIQTYRCFFYDKRTKKASLHIAADVANNAPFYELLYSEERNYTIADMVNLHPGDNDSFISKIYPSCIVEVLSKSLPSDISSNIKVVYDKLNSMGITDDSNPILIFFQL